MRVGALRVKLHFPESLSLKGKRRVLKSLEGRIRSRFNVSVSEVDGRDLWQISVLGVVCISQDGREAKEVLEGVLRLIEGRRGEVEVLDYEIEVFSL